MKIKWLFFDLGGTIYDETLSDKERVEKLLKKINSDITYDVFYREMQRAAAEYAASPFTAARNSFGIRASLKTPFEKKQLCTTSISSTSLGVRKHAFGRFPCSCHTYLFFL